MNDREPEVMRTLRRIKEEIYDETKHLTSKERVKKIKEEAEACKKEFGLNLPRRVKVKQ